MLKVNYRFLIPEVITSQILSTVKPWILLRSLLEAFTVVCTYIYYSCFVDVVTLLR